MNPTEPGLRRIRIKERLRDVAGMDLSDTAPPFAPAVPMDLARFLVFAEEMARLVAAMHEHGVTHRDIRPTNFRQCDGTLVLSGFHHAITFDSESPGFAPLDRLPADAAYIAPEQTGRMARPVDYRADLYALGGTLYALATGRPPFAVTDRTALIRAHLASEPRHPRELAPWMPEVLERIILRLLAKEPDERYQSASGLADDLHRLRVAIKRGLPPDEVTLQAAERALVPRQPRRCHGRDNALAELLAAFESVTHGGRNFILISGEAGVGKTSLVNGLKRPVAMRGGQLVRGKCEQFQRHRPLHAPVQALRQLLSLLEGVDVQGMQTLQQRLQAKLEMDTAALMELLPRLGVPSDENAAPSLLDPREAQARLTGQLVELIRYVSSPTNPLVLVLDDLQWADQPTLDLIGALLEESDLDGLLLIAVFRSEDLESSHALHRLMEKAETDPATVAVVRLENLPLHSLSTLIGEMLGSLPEETCKLAAEIHRTTQGNPQHAIELLLSLHREGALIFDTTLRQWTWDAAALASRPPSANVIDFLCRGLADLPPATADTLVAAACLGADTTLQLVALATGKSTDDAARALLPALERGVLVTPHAEEFIKGKGTAAIAFCHDRMQQAATCLRDETWRTRLQLGMARRLATASDSDAALHYRAAEHYAEAALLLQEPDEKEKVAALFLESGRTARMASAYDAARRFLRLGLDLLAPDAWAFAPTLAWNLHAELHVVNYCLPDYAEADAIFAELRARAQTAEQMAAPASIQVMSLSNRTRYEEAVRLGASLLAELGINVPVDQPGEQLQRELAELYRALDSGALERLSYKGDSRSTDHAAAKLMNRMVPAAFFCLPTVANWLVVHAARLWIAGKYDDARIYPMACVALATIPSRSDYATGYRAARAALTAGEATERGVETARARHVFGLFNCHWFEPLEHGLSEARAAHDALLRNGELEFACYTYFTSQAAVLDTAENLDELADENRRALAFADKTGNRHAQESYEAYRHLLQALTTSDASDSPAALSSSPMAACFHHVARAITACIFRNDEDLTRHTAEAVRLSPYITGFYPSALINFLESLALITRKRAGDSDTGIGQRIASNQEWLAARANDAAVNFSHLHDLIEAERLVAAGRGTEALAVYERAIRRARAHHRPWHVALATEKAARCYLSLDLQQAAHRLLEQARTLYMDWGATGKCAALESEFPFLRAVATGLSEGQPVFAAIQQLASIRSVPQLAATTAEITLNLSGATDVQILALDENNQWMLKAGFSDGEPLPRQTLEEAQKKAVVASSVMQLGLRLLHPVISEDAVLDTRFAGDPRFKNVERCAVLGIPVVSRNRPLAFVLLENRRFSGAFTRDLAEMIGLLCGQLGVSIENARLYRSLEDKVEQRTRELRAAEQTIAQTAYELTANIPVGTYTMIQPPDGGMAYFSFMSTRFLELTGVEREAACKNPMNAFACVHPDDFDEWVRKNAYVFEHKLPFREECRIIVRGETRWIVAESTPRDLPDGSVVWEGVLQDITERKLAEEKLAASEARLRRILNNIPIPVAINIPDASGRITFLNTTFVDTFGYTLDDMPTVHAWAVMAYPDPAYRDQTFGVWNAAVERAMRTRGTIEPMEFRVRCKNGEFRDVLINAVALDDMLLVGFADITERKRTEEREKELEANHRRTLETKLRTSLTASAVAHEINQPLSAILLQSKMAIHRQADPVESLSIVAQEAQRVVVTIEKMKTLLRNVQTEHYPVDLAEVVSSTLLYNKGFVERHRVKIRRHNLEQPCMINGDGAQLQLAFTNLVRNAVEAMDESSPASREILVEIVVSDTAAEFVIGDSGRGWSGAEKINSPLTTTKKGGTGIGLYVVRTAMENHHGTVHFGRSPLGGAEVRLRFARKRD